LISQGNSYHLEQQVRIPPSSETGSVFRLDAWLFGDQVIIEDPFMHVNYTITDLKKPSSIVQRPRDEFDCDNATLGIY
jgi:hypothetical protein